MTVTSGTPVSISAGTTPRSTLVGMKSGMPLTNSLLLLIAAAAGQFYQETA
jgi:hypothetical protein